jgi:Ca-activated chloride channel family protein
MIGRRMLMLFNGLEFKYPYLFAFFLVPVLALVVLILGLRKKEKILGMLRMTSRMQFKVIRIILIVTGLCFMAFSLAGPQIFQGYTEVKKTGKDIYVLIDTSNSMLVEDVQPNRISRAKKVIEGILDNLKGDRIGFIPFSSGSYIQMPLTDDYQLARMFLEVIDTNMIGGGGTNIGTAIKLAADSFQRTSSSDKVVIVLSDGEEHEKNSVDVIKQLNDKNLKIYTIGIGSEKGGLVPEYDPKTEQKTGYKKDNNGNFVTSRLDAGVLKELALNGNGAYYQSSVTSNEVSSLIKDISALKGTTTATEKLRRFNQLYQYFLGTGMLLLLIAFLLPERVKTA